MIDDFDLLVARCSARRRIRMIRLSLLIVGTILFAIASIAGYDMWLSSSVHVDPKPLPSKSQASDVSAAKINKSESPTPVTAPAQKSSPSSASVPDEKALIPEKNAPLKAQSSSENTVPAAPILPTKSENSRFFEVNTQPKAPVLDPLSAYNANPKYETTLAVARDYYSKNNFTEAAIWAKKANQMNREGEEAWLLYAKSYYAQGRKNDAIGILELYMNYKDSKAASELLRTWKQTPAN